MEGFFYTLPLFSLAFRRFDCAACSLLLLMARTKTFCFKQVFSLLCARRELCSSLQPWGNQTFCCVLLKILVYWYLLPSTSSVASCPLTTCISLSVSRYFRKYMKMEKMEKTNPPRQPAQEGLSLSLSLILPRPPRRHCPSLPSHSFALLTRCLRRLPYAALAASP